jgi:hypothetical protein
MRTWNEKRETDTSLRFRVLAGSSLFFHIRICALLATCTMKPFSAYQRDRDWHLPHTITAFVASISYPSMLCPSPLARVRPILVHQPLSMKALHGTRGLCHKRSSSQELLFVGASPNNTSQPANPPHRSTYPAEGFSQSQTLSKNLPSSHLTCF